EPGPLSGSLSESPMPIRSGAMQRPRGCRCGNTLRQRYDEVGLPCRSTMGSPAPTSTYAISRPRIRRRCFGYEDAAEIVFASLTSVLFIVRDIAMPALLSGWRCSSSSRHKVVALFGIRTVRTHGAVDYLSSAGPVWLQPARFRQPLLGRDVIEFVGLVDEQQAVGVGDALGDVILPALLEVVGPDGQRHVGGAGLGIHDHALDHDGEIIGGVVVQRLT